MRKKRNYVSTRHKEALRKHKAKAIDELKKEWEKVERGAKNEQIIAAAKETGMKMGRVLLGLLLVGGIISVGIVAPKMLGVLGQLASRRRFFERKSFIKTKDYLKKQGYIELLPTKDETKYILQLTTKGEQRILVEQMSRRKIKADPKQWDGRWRLVLFDIPEKHKSIREALRKRLCAMGLCPLQDSVFASPFPIKEEVAALSEFLGINDGVRYVEATEIGDDEDLKEFFRFDK